MQLTWRSPARVDLPFGWLRQVKQAYPKPYADILAQLIWQRQLATPASLAGFLEPDRYQPTGPEAFGIEMEWAIARLQQAYGNPDDRLLIWGDFDADGLTATAVLWEGLGQYFPQSERLFWTIPDRLQQSHGLNIEGLEQAIADGITLVITCDTGCGDVELLEWARDRGLDVIITDHHTLLPERPPVTALINPRQFPTDHPLATLSGVAVAYKLVEALYRALPLPDVQPLEHLLDLVAIGLIADLVELRGDCRYLAQQGLQQLQQLSQVRPPASRRPGITELLNCCKRQGDRPSDIRFGIGPRLNAVSRLQGKADLALQLLTGRDPQAGIRIAHKVEELNQRRQRLQRDLLRELEPQIQQQRDRTALVLVGEGWHGGLLGLVAGQVAHREEKPTLVLSLDPPGTEPRLARGSARSIAGLNLYELLADQRSLLLRFGGHPQAAGLSLASEHLPILKDALEQCLHLHPPDRHLAAIAPEVTVTVADLDRPLFRALYALEPCDRLPQLEIRRCRLQRQRPSFVGSGLYRRQYWTFQITDDSGAIAQGQYWPESNAETLPAETDVCDLVVELDLRIQTDDQRQRDLVVRLLAWRHYQTAASAPEPVLLDWRSQTPDPAIAAHVVTTCPWSWEELALHWQQSQRLQQPLALAYPPPEVEDLDRAWRQWLGVLRSLAQRSQPVSWTSLSDRLGWPIDFMRTSLQIGEPLGYHWQISSEGVLLTWPNWAQLDWQTPQVRQTHHQWQRLLREWQRQRQFFGEASLQTLAAGLHDRYNLRTSEPA
ncbi:single-stranded-DNA-specific exonuclease RecJ [Synechococcus elongatus]|uniref:Single-stranded-DNA-specific exonuclease RecJ n=1 Tax=Synechococcus elongatus PCC 11802 TaxID=2283154 RepID=A0AAT9K414_SYNEL|nr:single-stranded-DNA-specific exonuclease RecJ [Synechococcus elongatus]QFZ91149.1 single-stranded-DNA-specific exonuclease RecJ [Synechococcus elongatus PCC 11802]